MQKKSTSLFISFLRCCREIENFLFWVIWVCLAIKWQYCYEETFDNYQQAKINFTLYIFLEILQRYCKVNVLDTLDMPDYAHPKWYYESVETFRVYLPAKNQFHAFLEILERYANLFGVHWACPVIRNQSDNIKLQKTLVFIYLPKIKFIIHFFLDILHFKEPLNFIGWQHLGP